MKTNQKLSTRTTLIRVDKSLDKLKGLNLFEKKFEESKAVLLKTKLSFK